MSYYIRKQRWKLYLLGFATVIVSFSLWYTNLMVRKIKSDELQKVTVWADAVQKRASLVNYTEAFFLEIQVEERKRVQIWAQAILNIIDADLNHNNDIAFYNEIISSNTTIPVVLTDEHGVILASNNLDPRFQGIQRFEGKIRAYFSVYPPIVFTYGGQEKQYLYYQESRVFTELRRVLDDLIDTFISEVVINSASVPVIVTDSERQRIIAFSNIIPEEVADSLSAQHTIQSMEAQNTPLIIQLPGQGVCYVFYTHSFLLAQLQYYPFIQFMIIGLFLLVAYILFSTARNAEQNQVWVGMSKETAHQLGTPLSSLMAWIELLKDQNVDEQTLKEINKDLIRLENITERFSKIGSTPRLMPENIIEQLQESLDYIKTRTSRKVQYVLHNQASQPPIVPINRNLFGWVMENLLKNAVDAMEGVGQITINVQEQADKVIIDIRDTGKGIPKSAHKMVFKPGYSSKQRGWGLGLSLSKRIIEKYHNGRIFVKSSGLNQGATFRIVLNKLGKS